jgi:hypothetical protein
LIKYCGKSKQLRRNGAKSYYYQLLDCYIGKFKPREEPEILPEMADDPDAIPDEIIEEGEINENHEEIIKDEIINRIPTITHEDIMEIDDILGLEIEE